jgi:hypothetical protein
MGNILIDIILLIGIMWFLVLIAKKTLMGIWLVPLRQNQYFVIEKKADESKSTAGGGNFKRFVGYSIRVIDKKPEYFIPNKNGEPEQKTKSELNLHYGLFWRFIGAYPALVPGIDRIKTYKFSWGKITNDSNEEIQPRREEVDSFFDSFVYGVVAKNLITLDLQEFEIKFRVPLQLNNLFTACYENMPTGTWLNQYISAIFEGAKSYVGSKNSTDLLSDNFKKDDLKKDILDHMESYITAVIDKSGYAPPINEGLGVLDVVGKLSEEMKKAQEANSIAIAKGAATVTNATNEKLAAFQKAEGEKALGGAKIEGEIEAFKKTLPPEILKDPVTVADMWKSYQLSKLENLQAINTETKVMKTI